MKTTVAVFCTLVAGSSAWGAEDDIFFRARDMPHRPATVIESVNLDVLSPSLRAAVAAQADFAGVDKHGSMFRAPRTVSRNPAMAIESLNGIRLHSSIASRTREFALVESAAEVTEVKQKPVDLLVRVKQLPAGGTLAGLRITGRIESNKLVRLTKDGMITTDELQKLAAQRDVVEYVEPNHLFSFGDPAPRPLPAAIAGAPSGFPNDTYYVNQGEWGMERINAPALWSYATTADVIVAVIDTGADGNHEDLRANLIQGHNVINDSDDTQDDHGHGSHCAGIIGAVGNNALGIAGINWKVKIMPIKAFDADGHGGTAYQLAEAFDYAIKHGAKVINASWGSPEYDDAIATAVKKALAAGVVVVAAAGNNSDDIDLPNGNRNYPASLALPGLISVMAMDQTGGPANFSNYGATSVNLAAPGKDILSTWLSTDGGYKLDDGTSMAAPHVSGMAAALWSIGAARLNAESPVQAAGDVVRTLLTMVKPMPALAGKCSTGGYLYYDAPKLAALGVTPPPLPVALPPPASAPGPAPGPTPVPPTNPVVAVEASGKIEKGVAAIGGETTGILLRGAKNYEIRGSSPEIARKLSELNGQEVKVKGLLKAQPGIERPNRTVFEVNSVEKQ